ncbi:hypothetical protein ACFLVS_01130 [Chloroflexota bacterium]
MGGEKKGLAIIGSVAIDKKKLTEDEIRGLVQEIALHQRYQNDGFGLESVFEKRERAMSRVSELK